MQRKFIRFFGTLVSMTGMLIPGGARATDTPTTTPTETPTACAMAGQPSSTIPSGCVKVSGEQYTSGHLYYQQYRCGEDSTQLYYASGNWAGDIGKYLNPCRTPTASASGVYISVSDFCSLSGNGQVIAGFCEGDTIYCASSIPFHTAGCCVSGSASPCAPTADCTFYSGSGSTASDVYFFTQCASGYYQVGQLASQYATSVDGVIKKYNGCCQPCSGIRVDDNGNINTVSTSWGTNCADNFCWLADQNSYGIGSCMLHASGDTGTGSGRDNTGVFQLNLTTSCPYNS